MCPQLCGHFIDQFFYYHKFWSNRWCVFFFVTFHYRIASCKVKLYLSYANSVKVHKTQFTYVNPVQGPKTAVQGPQNQIHRFICKSRLKAIGHKLYLLLLSQYTFSTFNRHEVFFNVKSVGLNQGYTGLLLFDQWTSNGMYRCHKKNFIAQLID